MRVTTDIAERARRLLAQGFAQRYIALALGISRGSVENIIKGRWQPRAGSDIHEGLNASQFQNECN
jgi:transcriptional regulator with XRE-family HTH domain